MVTWYRTIPVLRVKVVGEEDPERKDGTQMMQVRDAEVVHCIVQACTVQLTVPIYCRGFSYSSTVAIIVCHEDDVYHTILSCNIL